MAKKNSKKLTKKPLVKKAKIKPAKKSLKKVSKSVVKKKSVQKNLKKSVKSVKKIAQKKNLKPAKKVISKKSLVKPKAKLAKKIKAAPKKIVKVVKAPVIKKTEVKPLKKNTLEKKNLKNVIPMNDNKVQKNKEIDINENDEKMPVFALRGSLLAQQQVKKTTFEIPSFPQAKIIESENKNSVAKSKNTSQNRTKQNDKKMNTKQVKVNVKYDKSGKVVLPEGYKPSEDEKYMNPLQVEYFRRKLESWKKELLSESNETIEHLMEESWNEPDPSDQATIVEQTGLELRTRDRYRKLISKIDAALRRVEEGEYGFCEVTGDPIGLKRLEARPIATMSIAAQEQHELEEKLSLED